MQRARGQHSPQPHAGARGAHHMSPANPCPSKQRSACVVARGEGVRELSAWWARPVQTTRACIDYSELQDRTAALLIAHMLSLCACLRAAAPPARLPRAHHLCNFAHPNTSTSAQRRATATVRIRTHVRTHGTTCICPERLADVHRSSGWQAAASGMTRKQVDQESR